MKTTRLLLAGLTLLASVSAFAADSSLDGALAALRDNRDRKGQIEAMDRLSTLSGGLAVADQMRVVFGLEEAYDSGVNEGGVRGRALDILGKCAAWFSDETAVRRAVEILAAGAQVDSPTDSRSQLKLYAWLGLSRAAGHLPWGDQGTERLVANAAFDGLREARQAQEKLAAMMILSNYLQSHGSGVIAVDRALAQRFDDQLLRPYQGGIDALYNDPEGSLDLRWLYLRSIDIAARSIPAPLDWRARIAQILRDMSYREPDARLKEIARLYAQRLGR